MAKAEFSCMRFAALLAVILLLVTLGALVSMARATELGQCGTNQEGEDECTECASLGDGFSQHSPAFESTAELDVFKKALLGDPLITLQESLATDSGEQSCGCGEPFGKIGMRNPAAVYCEELGYEYRIEETADGQRGVCVMPNSEELDEWRFYEGEVGQEFSYCARKGWATAKLDADTIATECTTCILPDGSHKTVSELLNLSEKSQVGVMRLNDSRMFTATVNGGPLSRSYVGQPPPPSFDWRNYNGQNWMTSVKNQGGCGSCWAFSAVGIVEPVYNIFTNNPNLDLNLAEQYLVSDCYNEPGGYGNCRGGDPASALCYIRDQGITDEDCFPYIASNCPCSNRCSDWSSRLTKIDETGDVPSAMIKQQLIEKGPLSVAMGIGSDFGGYWDNGIYRCNNDNDANHAVVIAGYNDAGGYWIVKNSWGASWNGNGYFNVGYGECWIENYVRYALLNDTTPPTVEILSPENGTWFDSEPVNVTFYPWDNQDSELDYRIFVDASEVANGMAASGANKTVNLGILPECNHTIRVNVTDGMGLQGFATVTVHVDLTPPQVNILAPANDSWFDGQSFNLTFQAWDNKAAVINYSIFNGEVKIANGTAVNGTITNITINTTALGDCNHVIRVNVSDTVEQKNWSSILIHIDLTPPVVEILASVNGTWFDSEPVNVTFQLCDNKATALNYSVLVDGEEKANGTAANCSIVEVNLSYLPECDHIVRVTATDYVGKTSFSEVVVHVDLTPPTVEILSPANDSWLDSAPFNFSFLPQDNKATLLDYSIFDGETTVANGTAANGTIKIVVLDPTALGNCDHMLRVIVTDKAGKANSSSITVHIDLTPPSVAILAPANDSWFDSEPFNFSFYALDNKAETLDYALFDNGVEIENGTAANGSITTRSINPLALGECNHVLRVNVTDSVGEMNFSSITIHVDTTPPTVEILSPVNGMWLDSADVNVTFLPCDNKAATLTYAIYVDGNERANGTAANCSTQDVNIGVLPECDHVVMVAVRDTIGKTDSTAVLVHVDLTPPTIEIVSPTNGTCFDSEPVNVSFRLWDNKASVLNYSFFLDGLEVENGTLANGSEREVTLGMLVECEHTILITATDVIGWEDAIQITIHVDLTPPTIEMLAPSEGAIYRKACVPLNFVAEDSGICPCGIAARYYALDGGAPVNITGNTTIGGLVPCNHAVMLYIVDGGGKQNATSVNFTAHPGDISGDGRVNIYDLQRLAWSFNTRPGHSKWNPDADLNCDNVVNIFELQILAWTFNNNYNVMC